MACEQDNGQPCMNDDCACPGFAKHDFRKHCKNCKCSYELHDTVDMHADNLLFELDLHETPLYKSYQEAIELGRQHFLHWLPIGIKSEEISDYLMYLNKDEIPRGEETFKLRLSKLRKQIPLPDRDLENSLKDNWNSRHHVASNNTLANELREANRFKEIRNHRDIGIGILERADKTAQPHMACQKCSTLLNPAEYYIKISSDHVGNSEAPVWHLQCFCCNACSETLADNIYGWSNGNPFCLKHYGQQSRPRCATCDHLIFSEEYTRAMDSEHHTGHFSCLSCDASLTGQRYILRDEEPHCLACYEAKFSNICELCKDKIGCDSKDLSYKDRHWHESCFKCSNCSEPIANRPFATKDEKLYCSECYDNKFAARCDSCKDVFKAGTRKYEYRGQQWHEGCFLCSECKQPIGSNSFIPRGENFVCLTCFNAKYALRCAKCTAVLQHGGINYQGTSLHKECFTCTNCSKNLVDTKITSHNGQPYCTDCYGELFANKCAKCTKPITGVGGCKFISFENKHWHSECFICHKCNCSLVGQGFLTSDEMILCSKCGH